jgi:acyl-CoA thioesterase FadM
MNLLFRMLMVFIAAFAGTRTHMDDTHTLRLRVLPNDLDTNLHMNNGRYLTLMDLGRVDLMIRTGLFRAIMREKWMPVIAGVSMVYRRSLDPFEAYRLETRALGWDERWFYMEQTFFNAKGELAARGFVKAAFLKGGQRLPVTAITQAANYQGASPALSAELLALFPKAA